MALTLGFLLLCIVWGTSWVAIKFSLVGFPPFVGAALRFAAASFFLYSYARWKGIPLSIPPGALNPILLTAFLIYVVDYGLIYWAEQYLNAGVAAIFFATFPLFTGVFANFLFRSEPFRVNVQAGLAVGFLGVILIFQNEIAQTEFEFVIGLASLAILLAAAGGAASSLIVKQKLTKVHPAALSLQQMVFGTGALFLISAATGELSRLQPDRSSVAAVVYLGLLASALAFTLYYWLLQHVSVITLSLLVFITPVVAVVFDWLLLDKTLSLRTGAGMAVVFLGVALAQSHHYRRLLRRG